MTADISLTIKMEWGWGTEDFQSSISLVGVINR